MHKSLLIILLPIIHVTPCWAYLDTTPNDFPKPQPISSEPYQYQEAQYERYIDIAAEKIAPKILSNIMGPTGLILNLSDKALKLEEQRATEARQSF